MSRFFCDSIIFWCIHNYDDKGGQNSSIGKYVGVICGAFKDTSLELDGPPKFLHTGLIHSDSEYFGSKILKIKNIGDHSVSWFGPKVTKNFRYKVYPFDCQTFWKIIAFMKVCLLTSLIHNFCNVWSPHYCANRREENKESVHLFFVGSNIIAHSLMLEWVRDIKIDGAIFNVAFT